MFFIFFSKKTNWFCLSLLTVLTVSEVEATSENLRFRGKMYKSRIFVTQMGPTSDFNSTVFDYQTVNRVVFGHSEMVFDALIPAWVFFCSLIAEFSTLLE